MFSFSNSSLILLVAHSIYKIFVVNKITQNMSPRHLMQKYHIALSFKVFRSGCNYKIAKKTKLDT
jgi:hypothetical protein